MLDETQLIRSEVVANAAMNRGRGLSGTNSYCKELRIDLVDELTRFVEKHGRAAWLDVCCGEGRALVEARSALQDLGISNSVTIVGVDLIPRQGDVEFDNQVDFIAQPALEWKPVQRFDLITCVHGLHYIGDKLRLLKQLVGSLSATGFLVANLDLADICIEGGSRSNTAASVLRQFEIAYNRSTKMVRVDGTAQLDFPLIYVGADDRVGANYTGQPSVRSFYRWQ